MHVCYIVIAIVIDLSCDLFLNLGFIVPKRIEFVDVLLLLFCSCLGTRLLARRHNLLIAVGAAELTCEPLLETVSMESVSAVWQNLYFFARFEIRQAD